MSIPARDMKSRAAAKLAGETHYCSVVLCKKGHGSKKYTSTGDCVRCVRERQAKWQKDNKDKRHEHYLRYKASHLEETRQRSQAWHRKNAVKSAARLRAQRAAIQDMLVVLRVEMPELLKEFGVK